MGTITFTPGDMAFIRKRGYDSIGFRDDLTAIYRLDQVFENDLHMSIEYDEAPLYYLAKMLEENPRYAATFVDVAAGYEKIADKGNLLAKSRLACMYRCCCDETLSKKGLEYAKEAAEAGLCQAQLLYGMMKGDSSWLRKAVDQGYPFAMHELGCWYYDGENGLPKNKERAKELWHKANLSSSAYRILWDRFLNNSVPLKEALSTVQVFMNRADYHRGFDALAGVLYETDKNYYEAYRCYKKAVDCGMNNCDNILKLYDKGFSGIEPRSYWQEKYEEMRKDFRRYGYLEICHHENEAGSSSEKSSATSQTTSSGSSYYMASEKNKENKSTWIIILVLIAAVVAAVKYIF